VPCCAVLCYAGAITSLCRTPQQSTAQHTSGAHSTQQQQSPADPCAGSHNWAASISSSSSSSRSGSLFASPLYVAFRDADYDVVWDAYAWEGPPNTNPWFKMDLSKPGLNTSWDEHVEVQVGWGWVVWTQGKRSLHQSHSWNLVAGPRVE
jgi:hypothetical protein